MLAVRKLVVTHAVSISRFIQKTFLEITKDRERDLISELPKNGRILSRRYKNSDSNPLTLQFSISESSRQLEKVDLQNLLTY